MTKSSPMMWLVIIASTLTCSTLSFSNTDLDVLDSLLKMYDRRAYPTQNSGIPTEVKVEIFLRSFGAFNAATMDYEVDLYIYQTWVDKRLTLTNITHHLDFSDPKLVQMLWKPEVFFPNAKTGQFQIVTVPNVLVRINPDGQILYMLRLELTFSCMMDLTKYPLDSQVCGIEIASFVKTTRELILYWAPEHPVKMINGIKLPQFELHKVNATTCDQYFSIKNYSCLRADFFLERSVGYHLVQSYLPTTLIVVISWVSFWLDIDAIPARTTLGVTTLLTISSESTGIRANLPPVSYIKALDVWMGVCIIFVFSALIEFTVVSFMFCNRQPFIYAESSSDNWLVLGINNSSKENTDKDLIPDGHGRNSTNTVIKENIKYRVKAKRIDRACRLAFPAAYVLFNILYWIYYMT